MLPSIVERGSMLRRLAFDPILVPLAASVGICITFLLNVRAFIVFMVIQDVEPRLEWVLIVPLLLELYLFTIGLGLLLSALFVRFRDVGQIWELVAQLLFFTLGIFYPIGILPEWAQKVAFLNPVVQVMQDLRNVVLGGSSGLYDVTAADVYPTLGRLVPIRRSCSSSSSRLRGLPARGPLLRGEGLTWCLRSTSRASRRRSSSRTSSGRTSRSTSCTPSAG